MDDSREYRCRNRRCRKVDLSADGSIPQGWIGVKQYPGDRAMKPANIGLFCSTQCAGEDLLSIRTDHAATS